MLLIRLSGKRPCIACNTSSAQRRMALLSKPQEMKNLQVFPDTEFACGPNDRQQIASGDVMFGGVQLSWFSRAQTRVAMLSTEAEYVALSDVVKEAEFVENVSSRTARSVSYCTKTIKIRLATNTLSSARSRHIDVRYHYVRHQINAGRVIV